MKRCAPSTTLRGRVRSAKKAVEIIRELTAEAELGKTYLGKVVRVVNFGAFVEILPGVEGLLHISEIAEQRIGEVRDEIDEGDEVLVKVIDVDGQGRVRLSRKAVLREQRGETGAPPHEGGGHRPQSGGPAGHSHQGPRQDEGGHGAGHAGGPGGGRSRGPAGGGQGR